jgi:hypothetical protein
MAANDYDVAVTVGDRKTPLLHYRGPVPKVGGLTVQRAAGEIRLVYADAADPSNAAGVVLDLAEDPGGDAALTRRQITAVGEPDGDPVVKRF